MERTQIYLTHAESEALRRLAKSRGSTQSQLIRAAIDQVYLTPNNSKLLDILSETAGSCPREDSGEVWVDGHRDGTWASRLKS